MSDGPDSTFSDPPGHASRAARYRHARLFPLGWLGALLTLYLIAPLVASLPRMAAADWASVNWHALGAAAEVSAASATLASAMMAIGGIPLGYWLARRPGRVASVIGFLVQLPLALPPLTSGILLLFLIGPYSTIGRLSGGSLTDSFTGVLLAGIFVASPFLIVAARSAFSGVDPILEDVAATLGHHAYARFFKVALPLGWPAIRAGLLLSWLRAFGEFGATVMVAYHPYSLPVYTYIAFGSQGLPAMIPIVAPTLGIALLVALLTAASARLTPWTNRRLVPLAATPDFVSIAAPESDHVNRPTAACNPMAPASHPATVAGRTPPSIHRPTLSFAFRKTLADFTLSIAWAPTAKRLAILGESGSGKSMTLRLLAGLDDVDVDVDARASHFSLHGRDYSRLAAEARHIAYVPQDFGLFPHKTVLEQWMFACDANMTSARYWSAHLGLVPLESRFPSTLSIGQRQRVAIVRALARPCSLILLDEPFSALDTPRRKQLRTSLRRLQREIDATTILVTHDPDEAALLSDEILVLDNGRPLQHGATHEVFAHPANAKVAELLGLTNVGVGTAHEIGGKWWLRLENGLSMELSASAFSVSRETDALDGPSSGTPVMWRIHPDAVTIAANPSSPAGSERQAGYPAEIDDRTLVDGRPYLTLRFAATRLSVRDHPAYAIDDTVHLTIDPHGIDVWPQATPTLAVG